MGRASLVDTVEAELTLGKKTTTHDGHYNIIEKRSIRQRTEISGLETDCQTRLMVS